jgi:hypothetical protein
MDRQAKWLHRCARRTHVLVLAAAGGALLTLAPATAAVHASAAPTLTGDAAGLRLVRQINRAYANVPGVWADADGKDFAGRFTFVMRNGIVVAAQALVDQGAPQPRLLVRPENQGTFQRNRSRACWQFLPKDHSQALTDVGKPLLSGPGRVARPRVAAATITVTITTNGRAMHWVIDKRTMLLRGSTAVGFKADVTNLEKRPTLLATQPRC